MSDQGQDSVTLPMHRDGLKSEPSPRVVHQLPAVAAEQVTAPDAAVIAGVGESTWWRLHAGGKVPKPNKLGGKTLWRVEELKRWIAAGCPNRATWQATEAARNGKR